MDENGHVKEGVTLMEGKWSCYSVERENGYVTELASLTEGEWSCYSLMEGEWSYYRGGQFNGGNLVMLQRWSV